MRNNKVCKPLSQAVPDSQYTPSPFLPGPPEQLLQSGQFNTDVDVLTGTTRDEGLLYFFDVLRNASALDAIREAWDTVGPLGLFDIANPEEITVEDVEKSHQLLDYYVGGVENIDMVHLQGLIDMFTDSTFLFGVFKTVNYLVQQGVGVHQYMLTHRGQFSFTQLFGIPDTVSIAEEPWTIYDVLLTLLSA